MVDRAELGSSGSGRSGCRILGGSPVPVAESRRLLDEGAFVKAVIHDGARIDTVAHFGSHASADLRAALEVRSASLIEDAFVAAVEAKGVKIGSVVSSGRHIGAELRTALELGKLRILRGCSETTAVAGASAWSGTTSSHSPMEDQRRR